MVSRKKFRFIGLLILPFIFMQVDWVRAEKIIQMADPMLIGICLIGHLPIVWVKSERWRYILSLQGHRLKWFDSFLICMSSVYLGLITPGRLGELVKVFYIKQDDVTDAGRAFSSVLIDRLFDVYFVFVIAVFGLFFLVPHPLGLFLGILGGFIAVVIPWFFFDLQKLPQWIPLIARKVLPENTYINLFKWVKLFFNDAKCIKKVELGRMAILTILAYCVTFFQFFLMANALSIAISFVTLTQIVAISSLLSMIPITIAGLGTREAVFLYFFGLLHIDYETTIVFSIGVFFVIYIGCSLFGVLTFWLKPLDLRFSGLSKSGKT